MFTKKGGLIDNYFPGFDPAKNYEHTLFYPKPLQARELNEIQLRQDFKLTSLANIFFEEGTVVSGEIKQDGHKVTFIGLQLYISGAVRSIPTTVLNLEQPTSAVYAAVTKNIVTSKEDADLLDKTPGENYREEGAARLAVKVELILSPSNLPQDVQIAKIFDVKAGKVLSAPPVLKMRQLCEKTFFDEVVPIEQLSGKKFAEGSRVLVTGGILLLGISSIYIGGHNLDITFHPSVRIVALMGFMEQAMLFIHGRVTLRDLQIGWAQKGLDMQNTLSVCGNGKAVLHGLVELNFNTSVTTSGCQVMSHAGIEEVFS